VTEFESESDGFHRSVFTNSESDGFTDLFMPSSSLVFVIFGV